MSSFIERLLGSPAGSVVTVEPDYVVINDGVSHSAVDEISSVRYPERVFVIYDHDVPTGRPEAAAVLRKNLAFADEYGCRYVQAEGVGYQYMLDEVVKPGEIVIGGGSHAGIFGSKSALGINVSIPELARIVETGRYSTVVPETVYVNLNGKLTEGVSAMDAAFSFLKANRASVKKKAIEIYAPELSGHELEVFCSVACITGTYTAGVSEAKHDGAIEVELSSIRPMVMMPCERRNEQRKAEFEPLDALAGVTLQAGQIGGYTGGTIGVRARSSSRPGSTRTGELWVSRVRASTRLRFRSTRLSSSSQSSVRQFSPEISSLQVRTSGAVRVVSRRLRFSRTTA